MILDQPPEDGDHCLQGRVMGEEDVHVAVDEEHDEDREEGGRHQHEQF